MTTTTSAPATPKQFAYLRSLLASRSGVAEAEEIRNELNALLASGQLDRARASAAISRIQLVPRPSHRPEERSALSFPDGRYALETEGTGSVRFYAAHHNQVFALSSDNELPLSRPEEERVSAAIASDPLGATKAYGYHVGRCGSCQRTLTDPESISLGIGPVCLKKRFGG